MRPRCLEVTKKEGEEDKEADWSQDKEGREKSLNPKATIHLWNLGTDGVQLELAEDPEAQVWEFGEGASQGFLGQLGGKHWEPPSSACSSCHPSLGDRKVTLAGSAAYRNVS